MDSDDERLVEVDHRRLSAEARRGLIEELITREGTEYGHVEFSLEEKVEHVERQLESGEARVVYDTVEESANIVLSKNLKKKKV